MKATLRSLFAGHSLSREEACRLLTEIAQQRYNSSEVSAFLTVFCMRCVTLDELSGFRDAMLALSRPMSLADFDPIDVCGTGGDGKDTFNISTLSAFVIAGSGVPVAKHGNVGVSSVCGSSNVLEALGVVFHAEESMLRRCLEEAGICYLHAPLFHPAMKNLAPIRRELGVRTFFNMLGPLVNPCRPRRQMIGVYDLELARLVHYVLQQEKIAYRVVHSLDGYDEISLTGAFKLYGPQAEQVLEPEDLGMARLEPSSLYGGEDVASAAALFLTILRGEGTVAQQQAVCANAGLALHCAEAAPTLQDAIQMAEETLRSGRAYQTFQTFLKTTQG
ncbi:MAG: anthranilate phosphoribosyltransferase [Myxococcales bacterium]|nr:anthranilate phosphoribosyltransferase [Myxococcales bacterium]MCB9644279.1 anthranilate phosphoribosyltransferase [Myxococcales bacterium]